MAYVQGASLKVVLPSTGGFSTPGFRAVRELRALEKRLPVEQDMQPTFAQDKAELSANDFDEILYSAERSVDALTAFSTLLDIAVMYDPAILQSNTSGLAFLFDKHILDISEAFTELRRYKPTISQPSSAEERLRALLREAPMQAAPETGETSLDALGDRLREIIRTACATEAARPAWHDLDTIAARSRVHKSDVARVMFVLTGEDHEGAAYRAYDGNLSEGMPAHLLSSKISESLSFGAIWGQISADTGLSLQQVKEVLGAMMAYTPMRAAENLSGFDDLRANQRAEAEMRARVAAQDANGPDMAKMRDILGVLGGVALGGGDLGADAPQSTLDKIADESGLSREDVGRVVAMLIEETSAAQDTPQAEAPDTPKATRTAKRAQ